MGMRGPAVPDPFRDERLQLIREFRQRLEALARGGVDRIPAPVLPASSPRRSATTAAAPPIRAGQLEDPRDLSEPPQRPPAAAPPPVAQPPRSPASAPPAL